MGPAEITQIIEKYLASFPVNPVVDFNLEIQRKETGEFYEFILFFFKDLRIFLGFEKWVEFLRFLKERFQAEKGGEITDDVFISQLIVHNRSFPKYLYFFCRPLIGERWPTYWPEPKL